MNDGLVSIGSPTCPHVGEHSRLHAELHRSRDDARDDLPPEHGARRDLHVVSRLEVRGELQRLRHADVPLRLERRHRDRLSGESVADKLRDHVQVGLLVRGRLYRADGNDVLNDLERDVV